MYESLSDLLPIFLEKNVLFLSNYHLKDYGYYFNNYCFCFRVFRYRF